MEPSVSLCVLASSSGGNCSVLAVDRAGDRRCILIDCGLSPRRTRALFREVGLADAPVHAVILTHLDHDHMHPGWAVKWPNGCTLHIHRRHRGRALRAGLGVVRAEHFEGPFDVLGARVEPLLVSHDGLGSAALRLWFGGRSLGYATDVGRATPALVNHLAGVDVLAIESNYCPRLEEASGRPAHLKRRIMGGAGHLSNDQAARAVEAIGPREHVVLLHLSRECNRPALAAGEHGVGKYRLTLAHHERPTGWIPVSWPGAPADDGRRRPAATGLLWDHAMGVAGA